jgi:AcrR family transcriptional regulator
VAQQLITYHFGSKEQLWVAVVRSLHDEFLQTMNELRFEPDADLRAQFREHQRRVFRDRIDRPYLARIWTQEFLSSRERFERILLPIIEEFGQRVSGPYFATMVRLGVAAGFTAAEVGLICNAILQLGTLNPFFVERSIGSAVDSSAGIDAQVALLEKIFADRNAPASPEGPMADERATGHHEEVAELKLALADLALENRRLKRDLDAAVGER